MSLETFPLDRLREHPWIVAVSQEGTALRVRLKPSATAVRPAPGPLVAEYLDHWTEVYDFTYAASSDGPSALAGWRASDTGEPLPVDHMTDWVDRTVDLVLENRPRHVVELGCGTGLLADRLYLHIDGYVGTDVADEVISRHTARARTGQAFVRAAAHEADSTAVRQAMARAGFPSTGPDCVLINSVTQCFPNVAYLRRVVQDAIGLVAPGGTVIIGDNRHAGLLDAYCRWLEQSADPEASPDDIAARARARAERDDELNFDPAVLAAAATGSGRDVRLAVYPKTMSADTELTRYRFDAVLRVDQDAVAVEPANRDWAGLDDTLEALAAGQPLRIRGIPNRLVDPAPDAFSAHELQAALPAGGAAVVLDDTDPTRLAVVAPPEAAFTAVTSRTGRTHEPFTAFVHRRVTEVVRATHRRAGVDARDLTVSVDTGAVPAGRVIAAADRALDAVDAERLPALLDDLDHVARLAMAETIGATGLCTAAPGHDLEAISAALGVEPRHRWILRRWLAVLTDAHLLHADGDRYHGLQPPGRTALAAAAEDIDRARRGLGYPAELTRFFQVAVQYLPALLRDEITLQALLFEDGQTDTAEGAYRDNAVNRYVNAAAAEAVTWAAEHRRPDRPLRVLEVGAGVGGTTVDVLDALRSVPLDYLFTDVSTFFLTDARQRFAGHDGLRYALFDINADPTAQGIDPGSLDVVLSANVLHNAHDIGATLRGFHRLLAPGGLMLFVETTREIHQILTSMQFLMSARPGRDRPGARDHRAGTDQIFLDENQWREELVAAGFTDPLCIPAPGHPLRRVGVQLFASTSVR